MFQSRPVPAIPFADRLRTGAGRRALGLGAALFIEALLVLLLLTLGSARRTEEEEPHRRLTSFDVRDVAEEPPAAQRPEPKANRPTETRPQPRQPQPEQPPSPPVPETPAAPLAPPAAAIVPMRWSLAPGIPHPPAAAPTTPAYGPPNRPGVMARDTERVGTAPNGQPMYAAEWYREPDHAMMRAYLSGANGPGWGLIACRTASEFRVEDCVGLEEYPEGSNIVRSALAAAWEFRVRPPRRGGQVLVGSWVRIRISYN